MAKNNSKENNKKILFAVIIVLLVAFAVYTFSKESVQFQPMKKTAQPYTGPLTCGGPVKTIVFGGGTEDSIECDPDPDPNIVPHPTKPNWFYIILPGQPTQGPCPVSAEYEAFSKACRAAGKVIYDGDIERCKSAAIDSCVQKYNDPQNTESCPVENCQNPDPSPNNCAKNLGSPVCQYNGIGTLDNAVFPGWENLGNNLCEYKCNYKSPNYDYKGSVDVSCSQCAAV